MIGLSYFAAVVVFFTAPYSPLAFDPNPNGLKSENVLINLIKNVSINNASEHRRPHKKMGSVFLGKPVLADRSALHSSCNFRDVGRPSKQNFSSRFHKIISGVGFWGAHLRVGPNSILQDHQWLDPRVLEKNARVEADDASFFPVLHLTNIFIADQWPKSPDVDARAIEGIKGSLGDFGLQNHRIGGIAGIFNGLASQANLLPNQDSADKRDQGGQPREQRHVEGPRGHALLGREITLFSILAILGGWVLYRSFYWFGQTRNVAKGLATILTGFTGACVATYSLMLLVIGAV